MPNQRFSSFPSKGAKAGKRGKGADSVSPIRTKNWPGLPGETQPCVRGGGVRKIPGGAAQKGL